MAAEPVLELAADPELSLSVLTRILQDLVQTESVNPGTPECGMADTVEQWLKGLPVEVERVDFAPGRSSIGVRLRGSGDGKALVLNGHTDTVPVDDRERWTVKPFGGEVRDGYLYGRGACDMKAGLAVQIGVLRALARRRERLGGSLIAHFAAGEERGEPGTLSLLNAGFAGDYGIVLEPTELNVSVATRGAAFIRLTIRGRSIHASRASEGVNPVAKLQAVLAAIDAYDRELATKEHPLLPGGSVTPTVVHGGVKENAVADSCELLLDRRLLPSEDAGRELSELRKRLDPISASDPDFVYELEHLITPLDGAEIDADAHLVRLVSRTAEQVLGRTPLVYGSPYGSDVRNLVVDAGMQALTFGPGSVLQTHCVDERVELRQVRDAALVIAKAAEELLGPEENDA
jgi:succinyl-diaminopimelate desuccinylase